MKKSDIKKEVMQFIRKLAKEKEVYSINIGVNLKDGWSFGRLQIMGETE